MSSQPTFDFNARESARTSDLVTSVMAAESVAPHVHGGQMKALAVFYRYPVQAFDDFELAERTGIKQTSVGKRRGELERMGYVERCGRRPSPSKLTNSVVYSFRITEAGINFYARETTR